jgi:ABC-type branched-subunit amino acid transport system substrate-binding protein
MKDAGADGIVLAATYNPAAVFVRDARESGWQVPAAVMGTPDTMLRYLVAHEKKTGKRMTNALLGCTNVPPVSATDLAAVREYKDLMDKRNPRLPSQIADANYRPLRYASSSFEGFIMARVLHEAMERAGKNLTRDSLRQAAQSIVGWDPGVGQKVAFGSNDNQGFDSIWLPGIKDDEFILVTDMKKYLTDKPTPVVIAKEDATKDKDDKEGKDGKDTKAATAAKATPPAAKK